MSRLTAKLACLILCILVYAHKGFCRRDTEPAPVSILQDQIDPGVSDKLAGYYSGLSRKLQRQSKGLLQSLKRREVRYWEKMRTKDSTLANSRIANAEKVYEAQLTALNAPYKADSPYPLREYIPGLDSMQTALRYLGAGKILPAQLSNFHLADERLLALQGRLQQASALQDFISERKRQLVESFGPAITAPFAKDVVSYRQTVEGYKAALRDPDKLARKILSAVRDLPGFQNFLHQHSYLSMLLRAPDNDGNPSALQGLQTKEEIARLLDSRFGSGTGSGNAAQYINGQLDQGKQQISQLQDKVSRWGGGAGDAAGMPDFKPNGQRSKTFLQRIEYGLNIQNQGSTAFLPIISDIALTAGYKLNCRSVIGIGASYKLGLGRDINHLELSSQGVGVRSWLDIKAKGSVWITGGFEYNYLQAFSKFSLLANPDLWQKSGLIGLTKKYRAGKKERSLQLLYDFLAPYQVPKATPLKFRLGFNL